jgi:hypothetical protein
VREYGRKGRGGQGRKRGKGREEGGEGMIRNDRPSPHQKILDPPLILHQMTRHMHPHEKSSENEGANPNSPSPPNGGRLLLKFWNL